MRADALLALAVAALPVAFVIAGGQPESAHDDPLLAIGAILLAAAPLAFRRVRPLAALASILVVALVVRDRWEITLPVLVAIYTIATTRPRREVILITAGAAIVLILAPLVHGDSVQLGPSVSRAVSLAAAAAFGLYVGTRRRYMATLEDRAAQLERERELLAREAVAEERVRIARELHDVVAHHISLVVVEAQALEGDAGSSPAADAGLRRIAQSGRDALTEMQRMLGVLRLSPGEDAARAPQPGIRDLADLIAQASAGGVEATLEIGGHPRDLSAATELSVYRIVQEALTNVRKHAAPTRARVSIRYGRDELEVEVRDEGDRTAASGNGHGLVGMRERVALFGGTLDAGPQPGGGFAVRAALPLEDR